jgi:3-methyladenine DNA glycosylase AlkC
VTVPRKGARRISEIPPAVLRQLEAGQLETVNLVEFLAVDQRQLLAVALKDIGKVALADAILAAVARASRATAMQHVIVIGQELGRHLTPAASPRSAWGKLARHRSDIVRSWAAFAAIADGDRHFSGHLANIRPFAADLHFGVREVAWLALRPQIERQLTEAIGLLAVWSQEADANLRRFASEATRPRGVWCGHIRALKEQPQLGLPILEPLRADASKYVRDSVGNWLNDAAKSRPAFVRALCMRWKKESSAAETAYIVKKAMRSL